MILVSEFIVIYLSIQKILLCIFIIFQFKSYSSACGIFDDSTINILLELSKQNTTSSSIISNEIQYIHSKSNAFR